MNLLLSVSLHSEINFYFKNHYLSYFLDHIRDYRQEALTTLHLSLLHFPPLDPLILPNIQNWCNLVSKNINSFTLHDACLVWAPNNASPRMLWLQYRQHPDWLALYRTINTDFQKIMPQHRFRKTALPHVTLGRFPAQTSPALPQWTGPADNIISHLCLWQAHDSEMECIGQFGLRA